MINLQKIEEISEDEYDKEIYKIPSNKNIKKKLKNFYSHETQNSFINYNKPNYFFERQWNDLVGVSLRIEGFRKLVSEFEENTEITKMNDLSIKLLLFYLKLLPDQYKNCAEHDYFSNFQNLNSKICNLQQVLRKMCKRDFKKEFHCNCYFCNLRMIINILKLIDTILKKNFID